jgi:hypothetical protein
MMTRRKALAAAVALVPFGLASAQEGKYSGPIPSQKDVPYLLHADTLVPTEVVAASQTSNKGDEIFSVNGTTSTARTPLAEPIFIMAAERLTPSSFGLYRFDVSGGRRQIAIKKKGKGFKSYHLSVRKVGNGLYRIEAAEYLENGEYSLSPEGENTAFCFTVY